MFSHVMVGSNDVERSKSFYDALFGKEAHGRRQGASRLSPQRRGVHGHASRSTASRRTMRNGGTIGFNFDSPEEVDAWHTARRRGRRHVDRGSAGLSRECLRQALPRLSARSRRQQALRPSPTGAVSVEIVSENKSHGGRQLVVKHASSATSHRHDLRDLPAAAGGTWRASCRSSGICRASPAPTPMSPKRASIAPPAPSSG